MRTDYKASFLLGGTALLLSGQLYYVAFRTVAVGPAALEHLLLKTVALAGGGVPVCTYDGGDIT